MSTLWDISNSPPVSKPWWKVCWPDPNPHVRWRALWAAKVIDRKGDTALDLFWRELNVASDADTKASGLRSWNAAVGLGMYSDPRAVTRLHQGTESGDSWIRWEAVDSLGRSHNTHTSALLSRLVQTEQDEKVTREATNSLAQICDSPAVLGLTQLLDAPSMQVRWRAAAGLGRCGDTASRSSLESRLERETHPDVRSHIEKALKKLGDDS